ncbi:Vacuolar protein sorting-associated protein 52 [Liparis tanakae]|uniref:Vacuolar protein sorting-associated protein 52 homolog n=1 Tax=Liparis tanakae TaxID=230148 RepID=A0A4Z2GNA2_9TELE|nr:Vacuolar protein sorting-associated protein 52 [Liparis tanakae]
MVDVAAAAVGAGLDVNTAGNPTDMAMAYLQDENTDGEMPNLNLGELDLTTDEFILDEVDIHIQANLEDDLVKEALKTGVDLRQYSKQVEAELQRIEQASIKDYIKESQNIALLHNQITACDSILERMEGMLSGFQSDLSSISSEIQTLQQQSVSMNVRLKNRQAVRSHLSQLVDELVVPGAMISSILDSPVTEQEFLEQLHELNNKINFAKELSFRETLACSDIQDIVDRLKLKAVSKIREFILQKIYSFRKPMTNYQIPQNTLLKFRFFYQFLLANERTVAKEIRDEYVDTMSKIFYSYFKSYSGRLLKVQYEEVADKDDLMGVEDTAKKDILPCVRFFSKPSLRSRNTIFTLGQRGAILSPAELEGPILVPHTAQRGDSRYPYETLFRSQHYALLDNGCREFLFLADFFMVAGNSALDLFNSIMGKTLSMFLKSLSAYASDCFDSIAVFLCIHIVLRFRAVTAKRSIPALDKYWEAVLELLWPRFELILEMNIHSIRNTDPQKLGVLDTRPHYLVRGFSSSWKQSVESMSQDVMRSFTNFKNGTSIIQGALTQLIQYYHGFHKILNQPAFRSLAVRSELINLHHLMVEVKKHKPNF